MASGAEAAPEENVALGEFEIDPGRPLPALRVGAAVAFEAARPEGSPGNFYALLCDPGALPRIEIVPLLRRTEAKGVLIPAACGTVLWPPTGRRQQAIILPMPRGGRLVASLDEALPPFSEEAAVRELLAAIVPPLRTLHAAGLVHGAVNPLNLYYADEARSRLILGECVSHRAAALQPASFAPIELAMTDPGARGRGQAPDDVFGLGMTLAFLLLGGDPAGGRPAEELLRARIESGSYAALLNDKQRLPPGLIELLRGLLNDDARLRWTMAEVEDWLPSHHIVTRQGVAPKRATRPFVFAETPYLTGRSLAHAFAADPAGAAAAIRGSDFGPWVDRALGDEVSQKLIKALLTDVPSGDARSAAQDGALAARIGIALDPLAPVRYRGLAAMPDGFGGALLDAVLGAAGEVQPIAEAVARGVPQFWLSIRTAPTPENLQLFNLFEQLRLLVDDRRLGGGIERLLYELNPTLHCLSPLIEGDCVTGLGDILPALERHADGDFGGGSPVDRHIAAFVGTKLKSTATDWMSDLSSSDAGTRLVGTLHLLIRLQAYGGPAAVPGLAGWFARQAAPVIERLHHRPTRRQLAELAEKATRSGRLHDLLAVIDNPEQRRQDEAGFAEARQAHRAVAAELERAAADIAGGKRERQVEQLAGELAAGLATLIAGVGLLVSLLVLG